MIDGVDLDALQQWMDRQGLGEGPIADATTLAGGTQNILLRFSRAGRSYILRRPPPVLRANSNETMRREAHILAALKGSDVPHPELIAACPDDKVIEAAFYLMEPIEGFNAAQGLPALHAGDAAIRRRMGLAMVEAIAALSRVDYRAVGLEGFGRLDNWIDRQVGRWASQLASYSEMPGWTGPDAIPGVEKVAQWLDAHRPAGFQPGIIHGDFHFANVLFRYDSGELAAVVDWELCTLGDPLLDLAGSSRPGLKMAVRTRPTSRSHRGTALPHRTNWWRIMRR
jgi:aminoglycoside phosphotransferase (APT) family kinase protein